MGKKLKTISRLKLFTSIISLLIAALALFFLFNGTILKIMSEVDPEKSDIYVAVVLSLVCYFLATGVFLSSVIGMAFSIVNIVQARKLANCDTNDMKITDDTIFSSLVFGSILFIQMSISALFLYFIATTPVIAKMENTLLFIVTLVATALLVVLIVLEGKALYECRKKNKTVKHKVNTVKLKAIQQ